MKDPNVHTSENSVENTYPTEYPIYKPKDELSSYITRFFRLLFIHKWLFLTVVAIVIAVIILYARQLPRYYQSDYEVFYNETMREFVDESKVPYIRTDFDKNFWLRAMVSDEIMKLVQKNSGLTYSTLDLKKMIMAGVIDKRREDRIPVFRVRITSTEREHIPFLIRAYIKSLNELLTQNQIGNSERLIQYLQDQIVLNNNKLGQIDIQIINSTSSLRSHEIVDFDKIRTSLDGFRKDLLQAKVNLSSIRAAKNRTQLELRDLDGTIVNESAFTEPLKVQLMNLEVDLARSLTKNKEDHPTVKQIRKNIEQIGDMIRDSIEQRLQIRSMIQNPLKNQLLSKLLELQIGEVSEATRVASLEKVISELEQKSLPASVNEDQQQQLRNRELIHLTIKQLNDKLIEAQSSSQGSLSRFVFIDDPSSIFLANKSMLYYIILAILLGILLGVIVVYIYDLLDDRIMMVEDYERFYTTPLLGVVRHYKADENYLVSNKIDYTSGAINEMANLSTNLRQLIRRKKINTIVISSPDRKEGKSLISLKLASVLANKKLRVLLVDMDFFSPKLSAKLFPENKEGLSNFIAGEMLLHQLIINTEIPNLKFVPAGNAEGRKELFYSDEQLYEFINWSKSNFDLVIFDTPAAMYIPDIIDFFEHIDSILVIVRLRRTTRKLINKLFKTLSIYENKNIHVIINDLYAGSADGYVYSDYYEKYNDKTDYHEDKNNSDVNRVRRPLKSIRFLIISLVFFIAILALFLYYTNNPYWFYIVDNISKIAESVSSWVKTK